MSKPVARKTRPCEQCGTPVTRRPKEFRAHTFCSIACRARYNTGRHRVPIETRPCEHCRTPITRVRSAFKNKHALCSWSCVTAWLKSVRSAELPRIPDTLPASAFVPRILLPWGAPQTPEWSKCVAWEQQRAADWLAARKPQAA